MVKNIEETRANMLWFDKHREMLRNKYPDQYIAIYRKKIIGNNKDPGSLIRYLRSSKTYSKKIGLIMIEYIPSNDYYQIL